MHDHDYRVNIFLHGCTKSYKLVMSSIEMMCYERTKKMQGTAKTISINWYIIRFWEENATTKSISFIPSNNYPKIL